MSDLNDLQAQFSLAYVQAVASAAGFFVQESSRGFDKEGIDVTLLSRGPRGLMRSPKLDLQVKSKRGLAEEDPWPYDLDVKNYEELRATDYQVPRLLVIVMVPEQAEAWLSHSSEELVLRRCGYWHSLRGMPATENSSTVRVWLPRSQVFDVPQVRALMERVATGGEP